MNRIPVSVKKLGNAIRRAKNIKTFSIPLNITGRIRFAEIIYLNYICFRAKLSNKRMNILSMKLVIKMS